MNLDNKKISLLLKDAEMLQSNYIYAEIEKIQIKFESPSLFSKRSFCFIAVRR